MEEGAGVEAQRWQHAWLAEAKWATTAVGVGAGRANGAIVFNQHRTAPRGHLEIGGGILDYCSDLVRGPEGGHPVTCRTVPPNQELTRIPLDLQTCCWIGYLCM